jgi:CBS domain-containing protein
MDNPLTELRRRKMMRAHELMTPQVITVGPETTVLDAIQTMLQHQIGGLPVVDTTGELIGIVSESDFIRRAEIGTQHKRGRWLSFLVGANQVAVEFAREHGRKVGDIMTLNPHTVTESATLEEVVETMESRDVKRLPVMRGNRIAGIITHSDFLGAVASVAHRFPDVSADDRDIRSRLIATLQQAPWRPRRLHVTVRNGIASLRGVVPTAAARKAAIVAAENVRGVRQVLDGLSMPPPYPPPEEDYGGGDFVSLQEQSSTTDDEPL